MTWISLVCLLALSGAVFGRSAYDSGYGSLPLTSEKTIERPLLPTLPQNYGSFMGSSIQKTLPIQTLTQGYGSTPRLTQFEQQVQQIQQVQPLTPADHLCRGRLAETVIPLENGRKFVVCLDDSKGVEQECPKGLYYNEQSRRCERKLGQIENPCAAQPCLNGGQCIPTEFSYECKCTPGFDGRTCELDARVCQIQYPCGQSPDVRCQSFRLGAALQYMCIFKEGLAYGINSQQVLPSPCEGVDGPRALSVSNKGFIMCDGDRMFVESCPGGTLWDDLNKACVWPDMQDTRPTYGESSYSQTSYAQERPVMHKTTYGAQRELPSVSIPKISSGYGSQILTPTIEHPKIFQQYGSELNIQRPVMEQVKPFLSTEFQVSVPRPIVEQPAFNMKSVKQVSGY